MIMKPPNDEGLPMNEGFNNAVAATVKMLEAYSKKHGGETQPEEVSGMLYTIFCLGYHLSGPDLNAFEVVVATAKVAALTDTKLFHDKEEGKHYER